MPCPYGGYLWSAPPQAGAQPFDPALRDLRMNSPLGRFPTGAPYQLQKTSAYACRWLLRVVFFDYGEVGGDLEIYEQLELLFDLEKAGGCDGG